MGGDTLYAGSGHIGSGTGLGLSTAALGAGAGAGAGFGGYAPGEGPGMRNSGVVLPRVKDENQSGDRWIETGAEVSVLWPRVSHYYLTRGPADSLATKHHYPTNWISGPA
jgi:hypothetical protein